MFKRDDRITALIQEELSSLIRSVKDPGMAGLVTLTGVELSQDRKRAIIFFSVFGDRAQQQSTSNALSRAADYLRHQLKTHLSLRVIPSLEFKYDHTAERAQHIEKILDHLSEERELPADTAPRPVQRTGARKPRKSSD